MIARYPGKRFQPYVGAGLGIYWARVTSDAAGTGSDTSPGVNLLVGSRFFLTEQFALFAEYKYNRATFDMGQDIQVKVDYAANSIVGGIGYHF